MNLLGIIIGHNLRILCEQKAMPIQQICDEMSINRQQFARYLNGTNIPRDNIIRRICDYFCVEEYNLLERANSIPSPKKKTAELEKILSNDNILNIINHIYEMPEAKIQPGIYIAYFLSKNFPNQVVRSPTIITKKDRLTLFTRYTGFKEKPNSIIGMLRGRHRGIVLSNIDTINFLAFDIQQNGRPSLLSFTWASSDQKIYTGHGITYTPSRASPCVVAIEKQDESQSLRNILSSSHSIDLKSDDLPKEISDYFQLIV